MRKHIFKMFHFAVIMLFTSVICATEITGKVIAITDGDTLTILDANKNQIKIRLSEIDTPESRQPYGNKARQELSNLAFGKQAKIIIIDKDRYGRTVGRVYVDGIDVNAEMIRRGAAWVYRDYSIDKTLIPIEAGARRNKIGLWDLHEADQVPPWDWRRGKRSVAQEEIINENVKFGQYVETSKNYNCASKSKCGQMTSCEEAKHFLNICGFYRLDGDRDGVPCENLCR